MAKEKENDEKGKPAGRLQDQVLPDAPV